jgi:hypothetical protein
VPIPAILAAAGPVAGLIGRIFGGGAKGASDQRLNENQQRLQQAQMQNQYALGSAGMDLQRRQFAQQEPNAQAMQALRGSLLERIQPLKLSGLSERVQGRMPQMNSIIDAIGPEARQAGSLLAQRGVGGLQQGPTQFAPLPPAQMAALKSSGLLEKILGAGGLIGSTVGALGDLGSVTPRSGNNLPIDPYGGG